MPISQKPRQRMKRKTGRHRSTTSVWSRERQERYAKKHKVKERKGGVCNDKS